MMEGRPIKFRLLELFNEGEKWNYEVIPVMQEEYRMNSKYEADCLNFDIIEICTAGFLVKTETQIDEEGIYRQGSLLIRYKITQLGRDQFETIAKKLSKKKVKT
ncbi:MAG: hypothetical protein FWG41_06000 [Methanomassiliicoccaceae archaeon]|nr:hypothetical protein [Methanomassiliicoccaceae archaeon]